MKKVIIFLIILFLVSFSSCNANDVNDFNSIKLIVNDSCFVYFDWYETTSNFNYKLKFKNESANEVSFSVEGEFSRKEFGKLKESNCLYALNLNDDYNNVFTLQAKEEKTFIVSFDYQNFDDVEEIETKTLPKINVVKPLENKESNGFVFKVNNGTTATVINYKGKADELVLPSVVDGYLVTRVTGLNEISAKKITMPDGVKELKDCFSGCSELEEIVLPNSLEKITGETLLSCAKLESVTIPENVCEIDVCIRNGGDNPGEDLGVYAFDGCTALKEICVDENNKRYKSVDGVLYDFERKALIKCPEAKSGKVVLPDWALEIDYYDDLNQSAFANCKFVETVELPVLFGTQNDYGKYFYGNLFPGCSSLKNVLIDESNPYFKILDGKLVEK